MHVESGNHLKMAEMAVRLAEENSIEMDWGF